MILAPEIRLNNDRTMPVLGLGTYTARSNECEKAVKYAIDCGYRHIDTAYVYNNERAVGRAIRAKINEGIVKREELFVVSKLANNFHDLDKVERGIKLSLENLGLNYLDLFLIHTPIGAVYIKDDVENPIDPAGNLLFSNVDYVETWKGMELLVEKGLTHSIGVSNFNSAQIKRIVENCKIKPVTNQVECHPGFNQKNLIEFCKTYGIILTAYCPLARPRPDRRTPEFMFGKDILLIGNKYGKTAAQIALRYLIQIGTVPIPKSTSDKRIHENLNVFDFQLDASDMQIIDTFNTGRRMIPFAIYAELKHKDYPFYFPE